MTFIRRYCTLQDTIVLQLHTLLIFMMTDHPPVTSYIFLRQKVADTNGIRCQNAKKDSGETGNGRGREGKVEGTTEGVGGTGTYRAE